MAAGGRGLKIISVEFEVFGKVQGVFFRKHTRTTAKKHGLVGWVQNTKTGSVIGTVQGPEAKVLDMKEWLKKKGSPNSRIDRCVFKTEKQIEKTEFQSFEIKKE